MPTPRNSPDGHGVASFTVAPEAAGQRLDLYLVGQGDGTHSRARLQTHIKSGGVTLRGAVASDPSQRVQAGDRIDMQALTTAAPLSLVGENIALAVLYEDADIIVIDKPAGLVVHPAPGHGQGTLVNALIAHCGASLSGINGEARPGIVHRLDKDTSGVMVAAKHDAAHRGLAAQFAAHGRDGALERRYDALVWGVPQPAARTIDAALGRHPADRLRMAVTPRGRSAITHIETQARLFAGGDVAIAAHVTARLETGRTHQIRVHLAHIGHPVVADALYGRGFATKVNAMPPAVAEAIAALGRQALHAATLAIVHPRTGRKLRFATPPPDALQRVIDTMR